MCFLLAHIIPAMLMVRKLALKKRKVKLILAFGRTSFIQLFYVKLLKSIVLGIGMGGEGFCRSKTMQELTVFKVRTGLR